MRRRAHGRVFHWKRSGAKSTPCLSRLRPPNCDRRLRCSSCVAALTMRPLLLSIAACVTLGGWAEAQAPSARDRYTGSWCWVAPDSTAREPHGPPWGSLQLVLSRTGDSLIGYHSAAAAWGNRIDEVEPPEPPSIWGKVRGSAAIVRFRSTHSDSIGTARLVPNREGLRWVRLSSPQARSHRDVAFFANDYLPWLDVQLVRGTLEYGPRCSREASR